MPKSKTEIKPLSAKRVKELISDSGMTQKEFAEKVVHCTSVHMSRITTGEAPVTAKIADEIIKYFPKIRFEWLMGYGDVKTAYGYAEVETLLNAIYKFENQLLASFAELYDSINYFREARYEETDT